MGMDPKLLKEQCARTLNATDFPELGRREEGKVRDNYIADKRRFIVVTDRVSCFDVVVGTLPFKGQVLNEMAAFWFEKTREIVPNHLLEVPDPNVSVVRECRPMPVEFVYRAYLAGSTSTAIWTAYDRGDRTYCGHRLPDGLRKHDPLPEPLLTPTTKAPKGAHDELASREEILERGVMKASYADDPVAFEKASPVHRVHADAQPFLVVHGEADTLVPASEAHAFVDELRETSRAPVAYAEIPGAQHAFELFASLRTESLRPAVQRFLDHLWSQHRRRAEKAASGSSGRR